MDIRRAGTRYEGSLTRERDRLRVEFVGMLELMAVLERFESDESRGTLEPHRRDGAPA